MATSANLGGYDTADIDIQADWYMDLDALGLGKAGSRLAFNTVVSYLDSFKIQNFAGAPTVGYAGSIGSVMGNTFPRWRALTGITYSTPTFSLGAQWRYIGKMIDASRVAHRRTRLRRASLRSAISASTSSTRLRRISSCAAA